MRTAVTCNVCRGQGTVRRDVEISNPKELREKLDLTQAYLAKSMNIAPNTWANYESGRSYPPINHVVRLAEILGADLEEMTHIFMNAGKQEK